MKSFVARKSSKKSDSKYHPFSLLEINADIKENRDLHGMREASRWLPIDSLNQHVMKSAMTMFLAEVLYRTIETDYQNVALFDFLVKAILRLDELPYSPNFHLWFLIRILSFYGIEPYAEFNDGYLDFIQGEFVREKPMHKDFADQEISKVINKFFGIKFDSCMSLDLDRKLRSKTLDALISYLMCQVSGFNKLNSRDVFEAVFSD